MRLLPALFFTILISSTFLVGCENFFSSSSKSRYAVAVIDLAEVAKATGRNAEIQQALKEFTENEQERLQLLRENLAENIQKNKQQLDEHKDQEEQTALKNLVKQSNLALRREMAKVRNKTGVVRREMIRDFKAEVLPLAREVAESQGIKIVMIRSGNMLYSAPEVDITRQVIDKIKKQ